MLQGPCDLMALRAERDHGPVVPADDVRDHVVGLEAATEPLELFLRHAAEITARLGALHQRADRIRAPSAELRQPLRQLLPRAAYLAGRAPEAQPAIRRLIEEFDRARDPAVRASGAAQDGRQDRAQYIADAFHGLYLSLERSPSRGGPARRVHSACGPCPGPAPVGRSRASPARRVRSLAKGSIRSGA